MASSLDPRRPPPFPHRLRMQQLPSDLDDYHDGGGGGFVANTNTASTNTTTTTTASNYEITQLEDDPLDYGDVEAGIAAHLDSGDSIEAVVAAAVTERNSLRTQNEQMWKIIEKQRTIIQQMTDERTKDREEIARLRDLLSATAVAATDDVIAATTATTATASTTSTTSTTSGARQGDTASTGADPTTYHDSKKQGVSFQLFGEAVPASPGQKGQPLKPGTAVGSTTALHGLETLKVDDKGTKNTADPHNSVEEPDSTSSKKVNVNRLSKTRLSMRISEDDAKLYNMYFSAILDSDSSALDLASSLFTPPPSKQTVFDDSVSIADVHDIGEKGDESKTLVETVGGEGAENSEPNDSEDDNDDEAGDSEDLEAEAQDTLKPLPPLQMPERMPLPPIPGSSSPADASPRSVHNVQMPPQRLMARSSSETYSPESFQASRPTDLRLSSVSLNYPQPSQSSRGVEYDSSGAPRHFPGSHPLPTPPSTLSSRSTSEPSLVINTANGASGNYPGGVPPLRMQSGLPPPPLPARESSLTGCSFTVVSSRPLSDRTMSFTIYVQSTDSWSVDRTAADFSALDAKVRSNPRTPLTKALPALEKSVFTTYTPLKFDQRKGYIEQYLRRLIEYEKDSREISEFLGINLNQPQRRSGHNSSDSLIIKEGFLHKKNKGLATWKARYYRCKAAILECYDDPMSKDVVASIKLRHCLLNPHSTGW
ncbi:hypothetical protein DFJ73DRAFT_251197 [Zopfochytrium polystomum]|nr:hypothetical protein DFJ73DRAFT_251197 [Zopfochytrium polystomum]